ncbi:Uncharacterised protein [uncultured archaeon]|nr:Uncharacterised protein [uncultured archaeon]
MKRQKVQKKDVEVRNVALCHHCGNLTQQKLVYTHHSILEGGYWTSGEKAEVESLYTFYVAVCEICHEVLLYGKDETEYGPSNEVDPSGYIDFSGYDLVYPTRLGQLHNSVPKRVSNLYEEAARIRELAPNAFAVQIRRTLEAICTDRGIRKGTLQQRLKKLASNGEIPPVLSEMTEVLRNLGNAGAHDLAGEVKPYDTIAIDEFFRAIVEYVYVAPSKLNDFKERIDKRKKLKEETS